MKTQFIAAPWPVKTAVIGIFLFPIVLFTYGFRLYAFPANPDAWLVMGVGELVYLIPALLVLKGSNAVRWFLAGIVTFAAAKLLISGLWRFEWHPDLQAMLVVATSVQVLLVVLLFLPNCREHFRKRKAAEPGATDNPGNA